jgi:hypothetical protein
MNYDKNTYESHSIDRDIPTWMRWVSVVIIALFAVAFFALGG